MFDACLRDKKNLSSHSKSPLFQISKHLGNIFGKSQQIGGLKDQLLDHRGKAANPMGGKWPS